MLFFQENIFFSTFIKIVGSESISHKTKIKGFIWLCHVSLSVFYSHKTYPFVPYFTELLWQDTHTYYSSVTSTEQRTENKCLPVRSVNTLIPNALAGLKIIFSMFINKHLVIRKFPWWIIFYRKLIYLNCYIFVWCWF